MLTFYTDPHLGLSRAGNTTPRSSENLRQALLDQALQIVKRPGRKICLGDMFDTFSNSEEVLESVLPVISQTTLVLSGNHDVVNQAGKVGSLQMLDRAYQRLTGAGHCLFAYFGKPMAFSWAIPEEDVHLVAVPHVANQSLFEESLNTAKDTKINRGHGGAILLLHCNYDLSEQWATETSLNLTPDKAEQLLETFDYIMLGHEHAPAEYLDGRVIVLGNTMPTGLGDISDKRIAILENGQLRFEQIWKESKGYAEYAHNNLPESTEAEFIRVKGEVDPGEMLNMTRSIQQMWRRSPNLYCVKVDARIKGLAPTTDGETVTQSLAQLPAIIRKELERHPALLALWDQLIQEEDLTHG
jgi:DNA repair exonuclease SbcCD nuclease subunit